MRKTLAAAALLAATSGAFSAPLSTSASNATPFVFMVKGAQDLPDQKASVVTIEVSNGPAEVRSAEFHCVLADLSGASWEASGKALNLRPDETRIVRIVGDRGGDAHTPAKVDCVVTGFSAPAVANRP